jgi:hypothetical protein
MLTVYKYHREQVSRFQLEQSDRYRDLDLTAKKIANAIVEQQDLFQVMHDAQLTLMRTA